MPPAIALGAVGAGAGFALGGTAVAGTIGLTAVTGAIIGGVAGAAIGSEVQRGMDESKRLAGEAAQARTEQARQLEKQNQLMSQQAEAEREKANIQNIQNLRSKIRSQRIAAGRMVNVAAQTGGMGGSALAGGISSLSSQLAGGIGYMQQIAAQNTKIGQAAVGAASASGMAQMYGQQASAYTNMSQSALSQASQTMSTFGQLGTFALQLATL